LASKRLININLVEISFAFALHFTKTTILNFISHLKYMLYSDHLSHLYYIMSDVKHHVNAKTSINTIWWVVFVFEQKNYSKRHKMANTENKNEC